MQGEQEEEEEMVKRGMQVRTGEVQLIQLESPTPPDSTYLLLENQMIPGQCLTSHAGHGQFDADIVSSRHPSYTTTVLYPFKMAFWLRFPSRRKLKTTQSYRMRLGPF